MNNLTRNHVRRSIVAAVLGAALVAGTVPVAPSASAHSVHRGHARSGYLALGDSVPFGYRPAAVNPDFGDPRSNVGYPEVLARHRGLRLVNASCPGETTASMIDATAQSNGCENSLGSPVGYRTRFHLHKNYRGSQLEFAVSYLRSHRDTRLVSLTIGANDLFLCQQKPDGCTVADIGVTASQAAKNVVTILSTLRHRAHYRHQIVLVSYYSNNYRDPFATAAISALNAALAPAASANHAMVADGFGAMQNAAAVAGGDTCAAGLLIALSKIECDVHPSLAGHKVLARALGVLLQGARPRLHGRDKARPRSWHQHR